MSAVTESVRHPGRPRRPDVEERVLGATIDLLAERGIDGTTMSAVIERSGVARATVYLRWPTRHALLVAAVRRAMGQPILEGSGRVDDDLRRGIRRAGDVFASPAFQAIFPAMVAAVAGPSATGDVSYDALVPGRAIIAAEYGRLAASQGLRDDIPADLVVDALLGAVMGRYLGTGRAATPNEQEQVLQILLDGLRRR